MQVVVFQGFNFSQKFGGLKKLTQVIKGFYGKEEHICIILGEKDGVM